MLNRCTCLLWLVALFVLAAVPEHAKAGVAEDIYDYISEYLDDDEDYSGNSDEAESTNVTLTCQNCILDVHCTNCTRKDAPEEQRRSSLITSTDKATTARTETTTTAAMTTPKHPTTTEATTTSTPPPSTAIAAQSSTETAPPTTVAATDPPTTIKDTA